MNVETRRARLAGLAAGLCLDAGVRVEVSPGPWCWEPGRRTIHVGGPDLECRGADYCAGVLAHEVGHYHISRYHLFRVDFPSQAALSCVLNGVEDPRVNTWIRRRYPGTTAWFAQLAECDARRPCTAPLPSLVRFSVECAREEWLGWAPAWSVGTVPDRVRAALASTQAARRRYAERLPSIERVSDVAPEELRERFRDEVTPRIGEAGLSGLLTRWEQAVLLSAAEALGEAERHILAPCRELWKADVEQMARHLGAGRRQAWARQVLSAGDPQRLGEVVRQAFTSGAEEGAATPLLRALARRVLETWLQQVRSPDGGRLGAKPMMGPLLDGPGASFRGNAAPDVHDRARALVADQVEQLVRRLEDVLVPRRRLARRSGFASGRRLDLRQAMHFTADPRRHDRMWMRPTIPRRRDTAFLLLVDLSGSMRGPKTEAALAGTLLLAETLQRLEVPFAVYGFQDVLIPLWEFGTAQGSEARATLAAMVEEIAGTRAEGNNRPSFNDDGPCLREAAGVLLDEPARDHVLIVVSDGLPEGRRSAAADLRQTVGELAGVRGLRLVGVGLGPNTEHVRDYYPEAAACVPPEQLADEIGRLLRQALGAERKSCVS